MNKDRKKINEYKFPKNVTEYRKMIWSYCRDCTGVNRTVPGACENEKCQLYPVYSMPRTIVFHMDFSQYIDEIIDIAKRESEKYDKFTMEHVRRQFYLKNGNGRSINYGAIVQCSRWRSLFAPAGEIPSTSVRTHGKKVLQWSKILFAANGPNPDGAAANRDAAVPETAGR